MPRLTSILTRAFLTLLLLAPLASQAQGFFSTYGKIYQRPRQSPLSVEFGAGSAYYAGDMVKAFSVSSQNNLLNLSFALGIRYQITDFISVRGTFTYFRLKATNDRLDSSGRPVWRNPDGSPKGFQSNNIEGAIELVHDILPKTWTETYRSPVNGYLFGGIGFLSFNPRSTQDGQTLQPQNKTAYSRSALVIPVGFGINYHFFEDSWIGIEAGYRFTNTDYLDDSHVDVFANPVNDGYYIYGIRASLQLYKGFAVGRQ